MRSTQDDDDEPIIEPQLETESSGTGGGSKIKTAIGFGGNGERDDTWEFGSVSGPGNPIRYAHLKDIAIDALELANSKDWASVFNRLLQNFSELDLAQEGLADTLSQMVVSAYTVAQYIPSSRAVSELRVTFPYFSDSQLARIIALASRSAELSATS